jgi:hypothetical protein
MNVGEQFPRCCLFKNGRVPVELKKARRAGIHFYAQEHHFAGFRGKLVPLHSSTVDYEAGASSVIMEAGKGQLKAHTPGG